MAETKDIPGINKEGKIDLSLLSHEETVRMAKIGLVALVDEATGYQYDREKNALRKLRGKYLEGQQNQLEENDDE